MGQTRGRLGAPTSTPSSAGAAATASRPWSATAASRRIEAGIDDLLVLKTTGSGWEGFLRDRYTSLPETSDRILATVITARWSYRGRDVDFGAVWREVRQTILEAFCDHYSPSVQFTLHHMGEAVLDARPEVERISFSLPNKHHLLYDLGALRPRERERDLPRHQRAVRADRGHGRALAEWLVATAQPA